MEPVSRGARRRRLLLIALSIAVPWLWFAVRDNGGLVDTVAVGLPLIGVASVLAGAVVAAIMRMMWPLTGGVSIFAVCVVAVVAPRLPRDLPMPERAIRVVAANVWDENPTPEAVPDSMLGRRADVVVAVEMPDDAFYEAMTREAAARGLDATWEQNRQAVWSRFPLQALDELGLPEARVMRVGVDVPDAPFVLYVVHGLNPFRETSFEDQLAFTDALLTAVDTERRPVVLAGDLNTSDRVTSYRELDTALIDAMRAGAPGVTTYLRSWWPALMLRIDHVFVTPSWCAANPRTFTPAGSDHLGVDVAVGPCA
ncbi:MAG TPA: endonuclease/exonuclease/phosphatase family protein [Actinomycetota bacterium]